MELLRQIRAVGLILIFAFTAAGCGRGADNKPDQKANQTPSADNRPDPKANNTPAVDNKPNRRAKDPLASDKKPDHKVKDILVADNNKPKEGGTVPDHRKPYGENKPSVNDSEKPKIKENPTVEDSKKPEVKNVPAPEKEITEVGGKTIDEWIEELHSPDAAKAEVAVGAIPNFSFDRAYKAVPTLLKMLEDHRYADPLDLSLRLEVTNALGRLLEVAVRENKGNKKDIDRAIEVLTEKTQFDDQWVVRIQALEALSRLGPAAHGSSVKILLNLKDMDGTWKLRRAAAIALGLIAFDPKTGPDDIVIKGLTRALDDSCSQVRASASQAIMVLGPPLTGKTELDKVFKTNLDRDLSTAADKETEIPIKINMYTALVGIDGPSAKIGVDHLIGHLKNKDLAMRGQAMQSINLLGAFFGPPRNNAAARASLDKAVLAAAEKELEPKSRIPMLTFVGATFVIDKTVDGKTFLSTTFVIDKTEDGKTVVINDTQSAKAAIKLLIKHLDDKELDARLLAIQGIGMVGEKGKDAIPKLVDNLFGSKKELHMPSIQALTQIGKSALPALFTAATDKTLDTKMQIRLLTVLVANDSPEATVGIKPLIDHLDDKDLDARVLAVQGVGGAGERAKEAIPKLTAYLFGPEPELYLPSIVALSSMGKAALPAVEALKRFSEDKGLGNRLKSSLKPEQQKTITEAKLNAAVERLQLHARTAIDMIEGKTDTKPPETKEPKTK